MSQNICNICGANYEYRNGRWKCPACGAFKAEELSNEEVTLFYNAAQKLRLCDFDEAEKAYTDIIEKFPKNPNGYWERLLSRYGIKYEEDFDGRKIPTCYAASIESVLNDKDYIKAISLADADTKSYFEQQAQYIERVRKEWIERARKEKPYDIFICYKDSDRANGIERTQDSIAAQDLYIHLTEQGYRVFFSRESLRDKVGEKYEPYIFNALSTAKVMLVYGTSSEYITSTWLKNEWTRYEKRLQAGEKKPNSLIVACDGFSPNELPKTLSSMQCFDATRRSFYTDLDTVLKRIIKSEEKQKFTSEQPKKETVKQAPATDATPRQSPSSNQKAVHKKSLPKNAKIAIVAVVIIAIIGILGVLGQLGSDNTVDSLIDSKYGVTITASDKIFDADAKITVGKTTDGVEHRAWVNAVNNSKDIELQNTIVYDITCDANITKNVTVKVPYSKTSSNTEVKVFYVSDNKATIEEHNCSYANSFVEFETNHFSRYVIGELVTNNSGGGNDAKEPAAPTLEKGILKVGVCADYPPYEYSENGELKGIEIDIVTAIAKELGLEVKFENDLFEDLLTNLANKSVDCIIGVTETEERNELASPSYTMFAEDDYKYIIYFDKSSTELKTKVNETINKFRTDGTINSIYKQYTSKTGSVKVIFDPNGGAGTRIIEFAEKNTSITMKDTVFTRPGYTFLGWGKYPGGEALYKVGTYYEVGNEAEYILYAIWRTNENTLVFDPNGGVGEMPSDKVHTGNGASLPANGFTREGYTFLGWSENPSSIDADYEPYETYWMGTSSTVTLYAIWRQNELLNKFTVSFDANGGEGAVASVTEDKDTPFELPLNTFTRNGYSFAGWSSSAEGDNIYSEGQQYFASSTHTLYAIWTPNNNVIVFNSNGGSGSMASQTIKTDATNKLSKCDFVRNGFSFAGWSKSANGSVEYDDQADFTMDATSETVLYAVWTPKTYQLTLDAQNGSGTTAYHTVVFNNDYKLYVPTYAGHVFDGWQDRSGKKYTDSEGNSLAKWNSETEITLYAKWIPNVVVYFQYEKADGSTNIEQANVPVESDFKWHVPHRTGFTFNGWFSEPGGNGTQYTNEKGESLTQFSKDFDKSYALVYASWSGSDCLIYTPYDPSNSSYVVDAIDKTNGYPNEIYISEYYNGKPVIGISHEVFDGVTIRTVHLHDGITWISAAAFGDYSMEYIVIPDNGLILDARIFAGNSKGTDFKIYCESETQPSNWNESWNISHTTSAGATIRYNTYWNSEWVYEYGVPTHHYYTAGLTFALSDDGNSYYVSGYTGNEANVVLPKTFNKLPVTSIGYKAFEKNSTIKSISMPNTIISISDYAFNESSIETIAFSTNLQSIGWYAFYGCDSLKTVTFPNSLKTIGYKSFAYCMYLETVYIPKSVTKVEDYAFDNSGEYMGWGTPTMWSELEIYIEAGTDRSQWGSRWARCDLNYVEYITKIYTWEK